MEAKGQRLHEGRTCLHRSLSARRRNDALGGSRLCRDIDNVGKSGVGDPRAEKITEGRGEEMVKPEWWPINPYPEEIFTMTIQEYVMAIPDNKLRTAISGCLYREGWKVAEGMIWEAMEKNGCAGKGIRP